jgi:hypothetical protein
MRGQGRIKLKRRTDESMKARKVSSMINSVNQHNLKVNNTKSKEQSS